MARAKAAASATPSAAVDAVIARPAKRRAPRGFVEERSGKAAIITSADGARRTSQGDSSGIKVSVPQRKKQSPAIDLSESCRYQKFNY
jgi:hypothetical protein